MYIPKLFAKMKGKFKLSQNLTATERENVIAAPQESSDPLSRDVAELMKRMD